MEIRWSREADSDLELVIFYLIQHWNDRVLLNFQLRLEKSLELILRSPHSFPKSELLKDARKMIITKHNTIFYKVKNETIFIIRLYDTRQNPKKL